MHILGCIPLGCFSSGSVIQLDHGASKKPVNPLWSWIHQFLWCTMIQTDRGSRILIQITPNERSLRLLFFNAPSWKPPLGDWRPPLKIFYPVLLRMRTILLVTPGKTHWINHYATFVLLTVIYWIPLSSFKQRSLFICLWHLTSHGNLSLYRKLSITRITSSGFFSLL